MLNRPIDIFSQITRIKALIADINISLNGYLEKQNYEIVSKEQAKAGYLVPVHISSINGNDHRIYFHFNYNKCIDYNNNQCVVTRSSDGWRNQLATLQRIKNILLVRADLNQIYSDLEKQENRNDAILNASITKIQQLLVEGRKTNRIISKFYGVKHIPFSEAQSWWQTTLKQSRAERAFDESLSIFDQFQEQYHQVMGDANNMNEQELPPPPYSDQASFSFR